MVAWDTLPRETVTCSPGAAVESVEFVGAGPHGGNLEVTIGIGVGPVLVTLSLELPVAGGGFGRGQTHPGPGRVDLGFERIVENQMAADRTSALRGGILRVV